MMRNQGWMMTAAMLLLSSCSPAADLPLGDQAIAMFHKDMNASRFGAIYDGSGQQMKATATRQDLVNLLEAIHGRLGAFKSGSRYGFNDKVDTSGHMLTLNYKATYQGGEADETFVYSLAGGKATLEGYHIQSNSLIAK